MPNRVVREGIIKSDLINLLGAEAEVFYRRLMSLVDDYGRYEGRSIILRADLFPLRVEKVSVESIELWKRECAAAGLINCYEVGGKEYLEILNFGQRLRSMKSKYPAPLTVVSNCAHPLPSADNCGHLLTDDSKQPPEGESESEGETESEGEGEITPTLPKTGWNYYPAAGEDIPLTEMEVNTSIEWIYRLKQTLLTSSRINDFWAAFLLNLTGKKFYQNREELVQHFRNWLKDQKISTQTTAKQDIPTAAPLRKIR